MKPYIDRNTKLRTEVKNDFEKGFLKIKDNIVFGKTIENVKNHRDIKLVTTSKRRTYLVLEPDYHTNLENLLAIEISKIKVKRNNQVYLGFLIIFV